GGLIARKDNPESPRKIDAMVAMYIAYAALEDYLQKGKKQQTYRRTMLRSSSSLHTQLGHSHMGGSVPNAEGNEIYAVPEYGSHVDAMRHMMLTNDADRNEYELVRNYVKGEQRKPNVPSTARVEVREIAQRSTMNLMPLLI